MRFVRRLVPLALLGTLLVAGGVAYATIGDGGVINGCYDSGGNLKLVSAPPCPKGYTALSWNQQGPSGPAGAKGEKGDTGPTGPAGVACEEKTLYGGTNGENVVHGGSYSLARQTSPALAEAAIDTAVCPGTLKKFAVTLSGGSGWRFDIRVNGSLSSAGCFVTSTGSFCAGDVSISVGDEISVAAGKPGPTGGGTGPSATWSADFVPGPTIP